MAELSLPAAQRHFLAEAFRDTLHWGAYMTDLLTEVNSKSNTLDLSDKTIHRDVVVLVEQLQAVGAADPLVIVIGTKAAKAFKEHEPVLAAALGLTSVRWVAVPHYSAANGRVHGNSPDNYRRLVLEALKDAGIPLGPRIVRSREPDPMAHPRQARFESSSRSALRAPQ